MKRLTKILIALIFLTASAADADNYEGYHSSLKDIGIWRLDTDNTGKTIRRLSFAENPEFALFCDGAHAVFIYELPAGEYLCKTEYYIEPPQAEYSAQQYKTHLAPTAEELRNTINQARENPNSAAAEAQYFVSLHNPSIKFGDIYTVSKTKLTHGNWLISQPTKSELAAAIKLAAQKLPMIPRESGYTYKSILGYSNTGIKRLYGRDNVKNQTLKIRAGDKTIIIIPSLYIHDGMGGDLFSTIIAQDQQRFRFIGHAVGCLRSVGADLDYDGFPEVILETCEPGEGITISYVKLFPELKTLIFYEHN